jgi:hypothetical protein
LVAALLAAGCATAPPPPTPTPFPTTPGPTAEPAVPALFPGEAFTYKTSGIYNTGREETLVVASRNASGYLFAGASKEDLYESAVWGREWTGPHTLGFDPVGEDARHLFDFPLAEGKSWAFSKDVTVVAHKTPAGYHIQASGGKSTVSYDYDASVGFLSRYHSSAERPYDAIDLVKASRVTGYAWYVPGPAADAGTGAPAPVPRGTPAPDVATLDVPAGFDAMLLSPGGTSGSVTVTPPGGAQPFSWQAAAGGESWAYAALPATEGKWVLAAAPGSDPNGFSFVRAVAVKWVSGSTLT